MHQLVLFSVAEGDKVLFLYGQLVIAAGLSDGGPSLVLVAEAGDELATILGTPLDPMDYVPTDDECVWSYPASSLVRPFDQIFQSIMSREPPSAVTGRSDTVYRRRRMPKPL